MDNMTTLDSKSATAEKVFIRVMWKIRLFPMEYPPKDTEHKVQNKWNEWIFFDITASTKKRT